jgi:hypothetical protein
MARSESLSWSVPEELSPQEEFICNRMKRVGRSYERRHSVVRIPMMVITDSDPS